MCLSASLGGARGSFGAPRTFNRNFLTRVRASVFGACGMAVIAIASPVAPAAAQDLIYERPPAALRPPVYVPRPRGPLHYVMLPPAEVRRRLQSMGYWQISRPELSGRVYSLTAVDDEGPVNLHIDAYSGEVLGARPLVALPPGAGRPPLVPPAPVTAAPPRPVVPRAPLPPARPVEADVAVSAPVPPPASAPAAAGVVPSGVSPGAPAGALPAVSSTPAGVAQPLSTSGTQSPAAPSAVAQTGASDATAAPVQPVAAPTSSGGATTAGSATPGGSSAGSASVLSSPSGTD